MIPLTPVPNLKTGFTNKKTSQLRLRLWSFYFPIPQLCLHHSNGAVCKMKDHVYIHFMASLPDYLIRYSYNLLPRHSVAILQG